MNPTLTTPQGGEPPVPTTPLGTEQPQQPTEPSNSSLSRRAEIYSRIYGQEPQQPTEPPVQPTPPVEPPATPTPPPEPTPATAGITQEQMAALLEVLQSQQTQIEELVTKRTDAPSSSPLPPSPSPTATPAQQQDWIQAMREGRWEDAKRINLEAAKAAIEPEIQTYRQQVLNEALTLMRVETDLTNFISQVEKDPQNAEILPYQDYIAAAVDNRLRSELASPNSRLKDPVEYGQKYKQVLTEEINKVRTLVQSTRAAGRTDASTVRSQVVVQAPVAPSQPTQEPGVVVQPSVPPVPTTQDYIRQRQERLLKARNLI